MVFFLLIQKSFLISFGIDSPSNWLHFLFVQFCIVTWLFLCLFAEGHFSLTLTFGTFYGLLMFLKSSGNHYSYFYPQMKFLGKLCNLKKHSKCWKFWKSVKYQKTLRILVVKMFWNPRTKFSNIWSIFEITLFNYFDMWVKVPVQNYLGSKIMISPIRVVRKQKFSFTSSFRQ